MQHARHKQSKFTLDFKCQDVKKKKKKKSSYLNTTSDEQHPVI